MKKIIIGSICTVLLITGCSLPKFSKIPVFLKKTKTVGADSRYYEIKAQTLVRRIYYDSGPYDIKRVAVLDLIDIRGNVSYMGKFFGYKISSVVAQGRYFTLIQRGELYNAVDQLGIGSYYDEINSATIAKLGGILNVDAIIMGSIIDIGTNFDVTLMSIDVKTGEIIASASEELARTRFAVDLMAVF